MMLKMYLSNEDLFCYIRVTCQLNIVMYLFPIESYLKQQMFSD